MDQIESHFDDLKQGREEAFHACYPEMKRVVTVAINSIAHNPKELFVNDSVSYAIVQVWQNLKKLPNPQSLRGYLRKIGKNRFRTLCKQENRANPSLETVPAKALLSITYDEVPLTAIDEPSEGELLDEALLQMPPKSRAIIEARILANETQETVAQKLNIPLGSMTHGLRRALKELKQIYLKLQRNGQDYE